MFRVLLLVLVLKPIFILVLVLNGTLRMEVGDLIVKASHAIIIIPMRRKGSAANFKFPDIIFCGARVFTVVRVWGDI